MPDGAHGDRAPTPLPTGSRSGRIIAGRGTTTAPTGCSRTGRCGASPGDQILEGVIPLRGRRRPVAVTVASRWEPAASPLPMWLGVLRRCAVRRRRVRCVAGVGVPDHAVAASAGGVRPRRRAVAVPVAAGRDRPLDGVVAAPGDRRHVRARRHARRVRPGTDSGPTPRCSRSASNSPIWGWIKRDGLSAALIPTGAPGLARPRSRWRPRCVGGRRVRRGLALCFLFAAGQRRPSRQRVRGARQRVDVVSVSRAATGSPHPARR